MYIQTNSNLGGDASHDAGGWASLAAALSPGDATPAHAAEALDSFAERLAQANAVPLSTALARLVQASTREECASRIRSYAQRMRSGTVALGAHAPSNPSAAFAMRYTQTAQGRVWSEMTSSEKHQLFHDNPDVFAKLHAEHAVRKTERSERAVLIAQGRRERKLTPELETFWAGRPVAALRQWLAVAPVAAAVRR